MAHLLIPVLAVAAVVLQTTLVPQIGSVGAAPDLIFLMVMFFALQRETTLGLWTAFGLGLLQDIACGGPLGMNALALLCLAFLIGYLRRQLFKENISAQVLMLLLLTFLHQFLVFFWMNTVLDTGYPFGEWVRRALVMSLYHIVLGPLVFRFLGRWVRGEDITKRVIQLRKPYGMS